MKVVLDIETVQAPRDEWVRLLGKPPANEGSYPAEGGFDLFSADGLMSSLYVVGVNYPDRPASIILAGGGVAV